LNGPFLFVQLAFLLYEHLLGYVDCTGIN